MQTGLSRFLATPENRAALAASETLVGNLTSSDHSALRLLYLHGPSGCGKTWLVQALANELRDSGFSVELLSANNFASDPTADADLLILEDLQHLPTRQVSSLIALLDERARLQVQTIVTALDGPSTLAHRGESLPVRLTNRLAAGLVVAVAPMQRSSRRRLLDMLAAQTKVNVPADILDWLARHLQSGRELEGAVRGLRTLQRTQKSPLRLADVESHFGSTVEANTLSLERIVQHVGDRFEVPPKRLLTARRGREVMLPRQVSMYLARQLTSLSLHKIGAYFGGRDHKTVGHACMKVQAALRTDARLCGIVRQLQADLTSLGNTC